MTYSLTEQIDELKRELAMRRMVYPRQVARDKMTEALADARMEILRDAIRSLEWLRGMTDGTRQASSVNRP